MEEVGKYEYIRNTFDREELDGRVKKRGKGGMEGMHRDVGEERQE